MQKFFAKSPHVCKSRTRRSYQNLTRIWPECMFWAHAPRWMIIRRKLASLIKSEFCVDPTARRTGKVDTLRNQWLHSSHRRRRRPGSVPRFTDSILPSCVRQGLWGVSKSFPLGRHQVQFMAPSRPGHPSPKTDLWMSGHTEEGEKK